MASKEKTVLVTGAAGFVGSNLSELLLKNKYKVIGLFFGNKQKAERLLSDKNFKIVECDIRNFDDVFKVLKEYGPEGIFHTAALLPKDKDEDPFDFLKINTLGTLNLLEACRLLNIKKFIYSSSTTVYGRSQKCFQADEKYPVNPSNFYELTKLEGENFCKFYYQKYGIKTIILRYAGVFGRVRENGAVAVFIKNALLNKPLNIFKNISWNIIFVNDVAKANILAFEKLHKLNFEIINISIPKEINIKDLAQKIIKISGSKSKIKISKSSNNFCLSCNANKAKKMLKFKPLSIDEAIVKYIEEIKKDNF